MANTYVQAYFHIVFAVKNRQALIQKRWKDELEKYVSTIVQNHGHKLIAIGSMPDHIHIFIGYKLTQTIPKLVEEIKTSSNAWVKPKIVIRKGFCSMGDENIVNQCSLTNENERFAYHKNDHMLFILNRQHVVHKSLMTFMG